ncbi:hypothetical protein PLICRDRAFT_46676 [Plicaturopsis crispa FD-325 SS-3]|uniref:Unplaced genomic scaffold PLICRscaffold_20, whole genome shotgun sequence n=1 Tax=Plicaturopsis crispa FD-325 SS-3 TaxID=944288 RepID=A0A0C9SQL5_PLICR|nr:hypothetical protein PLICRDRAFT_46676 [Plicaturopsis crispa FD-325 SS-3]
MPPKRSIQETSRAAAAHGCGDESCVGCDKNTRRPRAWQSASLAARGFRRATVGATEHWALAQHALFPPTPRWTFLAFPPHPSSSSGAAGVAMWRLLHARASIGDHARSVRELVKPVESIVLHIHWPGYEHVQFSRALRFGSECLGTVAQGVAMCYEEFFEICAREQRQPGGLAIGRDGLQFTDMRLWGLWTPEGDGKNWVAEVSYAIEQGHYH